MTILNNPYPYINTLNEESSQIEYRHSTIIQYYLIIKLIRERYYDIRSKTN